VSIPNTNCVYQVIEVRKAAEVYGDRDRGHYACAIEVFEKVDEDDEIDEDCDTDD
jgi:hypothetical protein